MNILLLILGIIAFLAGRKLISKKYLLFGSVIIFISIITLISGVFGLLGLLEYNDTSARYLPKEGVPSLGDIVRTSEEISSEDANDALTLAQAQVRLAEAELTSAQAAAVPTLTAIEYLRAVGEADLRVALADYYRTLGRVEADQAGVEPVERETNLPEQLQPETQAPVENWFTRLSTGQRFLLVVVACLAFASGLLLLLVRGGKK